VENVGREISKIMDIKKYNIFVDEVALYNKISNILKSPTLLDIETIKERIRSFCEHKNIKNIGYYYICIYVF
jgi:hypothetical protein